MANNDFNNSYIKASLKNRILISFFIVLSFAGIAINLIFMEAIQKVFSRIALQPAIIKQITKYFVILGSGITMSGIIAALIIAYFMSRYITRPIKELTDGMIELAEGKRHSRIKIKSYDEVGQLAEGFNFMADHIQESLKKLEAAKEYADSILASVPSILIVLSNRSNILSVNKAFEKLQKKFPSITTEQFTSLLENEIRKNLETGILSAHEIVLTPAGSDVNLILTATISRIGNEESVFSQDERAAVLLSIKDITERNRMQEMVLAGLG